MSNKKRALLCALVVAAWMLLFRQAWAGPPFVLVHSGTTVGASPTAVDTSASHVFVKLWNNCSQTVYVGFSAAISATTGIPVPAGGWVEFDLDSSAGNRLFAVVSSGTCDVRTLEKK